MKAGTITVRRLLCMPCGRYTGKRERRRYALDLAATIFPSTLSKKQHHIYNFSAELTQPVDQDTLRQALESVRRRFPTIMASLHAGLCWYHLEPLAEAPVIQDGLADRLRPISGRGLRKSCLRVSCEGATISVDFFHALTDGYGALVFLATLLAEYVRLRDNIPIPAVGGVYSCTDKPSEAEAEDSYARYAGGDLPSEEPIHAYKHYGTLDGRQHCTRITMDAALLHQRARDEGVSVTEYLAALMLQAAERVKADGLPAQRERPVRLAIPVNLRAHFSSRSLRNFALCCTVGSAPDQPLAEMCASVYQQLAAQNTAERMAGMMRANEKLRRIARYALPPLALKNIAMKIGYRLQGSNSCTMSMSNLGRVVLPEALTARVRDLSCRMDTNAYDTHSCTVLTYRDTLSLFFCRSVKETTLEDHFAALLQGEGIVFGRINEGLGDD